VENLICPATYDLGEDMRMVIISVTEGEDKPEKSNSFFECATAVITKADLLPYVDADVNVMKRHIAEINPKMVVFETVLKTGCMRQNTAPDTLFIVDAAYIDGRVAPSSTLYPHNALLKAGVESTRYVLDGGGHGGPAYSQLPIMTQVKEFFDKHLKS